VITVLYYESPLLEGKKKKTHLYKAQNLVPKKHYVLEITGHSIPSVPASNASSSVEK